MSFIINKDAFRSVFELAKIMISGRHYSNDLKLVVKLDMLEKAGINPDIGLLFNSTNFDTSIIKHERGYVVHTCNNHGFWEQLDEFMSLNEEEWDSSLYAIVSAVPLLHLESGTIHQKKHGLIKTLKERVEKLTDDLTERIRQ